MRIELSLFLALLTLQTTPIARAGSATWNLNPTSGSWNTAANWTPATVPDSPSDTATFATSATTSLSLASSVTLSALVLNPGASSYSFANNPSLPLTFSGAGVVNNSGRPQRFVLNWDESANFNGINFTNAATAGKNTAFTVLGGSNEFATAGTISFSGSASADHARMEITPSSRDAFADGEIGFFESSTAANATITNNGGLVVFAETATAADASLTEGSGTVFFTDSASAGNCTLVASTNVFFRNAMTADHANITLTAPSAYMEVTDSATMSEATVNINGASTSGGAGAFMIFGSGADSPTAGNATLIAHGGSNGGFGASLLFGSASSGGTSKIKVFGNGYLDISTLTVTGLTIGSLEGDGVVYVGTRNLTVGSDGLSTVFSGVIHDGGRFGSLSKIGAGTLILSGASDYIGVTTVKAGTLLVANLTGSGTGVGAVAVKAGTLGGSGIITGAVTVGTGSSKGAHLAPAGVSHQPATLTLQDSLTFNADATYSCTMKAKGQKVRIDEVVANGVTINGAAFALSGLVQGTLVQGRVLIVISNTAATPIAGTFGNMPDGAVLTLHGNHLQASYSGGDGNDLTLTVVP